MIPQEGRTATAVTSCQPRQEPNESAPRSPKGGRSERQLAEALVTQDWLGRPETAPGSHGAGRGPPRPARETCQRQVRWRSVQASDKCLCPHYRTARGRVGRPSCTAGGHLPLGGPSPGHGITMSCACAAMSVAPAPEVKPADHRRALCVAGDAFRVGPRGAWMIDSSRGRCRAQTLWPRKWMPAPVNPHESPCINGAGLRPSGHDTDALREFSTAPCRSDQG